MADVSDGTGTGLREVRGRRDRDDGQVVDRGDGAGRDACAGQLRPQGILVEEVAQQVGGDPGVECLQPRPGLPG